MASMIDVLRQTSDSKGVQRRAATNPQSQRIHLRDSNGIAPPSQLGSELARMKAEAKAMKDKGKDQWKRSTQRGTQIYGQMKAKAINFEAKLQGQLEAKLQGHLPFGTSSSSGARSSTSLEAEMMQSLGKDPKVSCLCDLGLSRPVAQLALKQTQGSSINDALDWVYDPANREMIEKAAAGAPLPIADEASPPASSSDAQVSEASGSAMTEPSAISEECHKAPASQEPDVLKTTPQPSPRVSRRVSIGRLARVSNDGYGLGMGMGSGRASRGRSSQGRKSNPSPLVTPRSPMQHSSNERDSQRLSAGLCDDNHSEDSDDLQVLYSARGSAYRVRALSLERVDAPPRTSLSMHSQDDYDEASVSASEEEEEQIDDKQDGEQIEDDMLPLPPSSASWDWPLSRTEKKTRVQLIEERMHLIDRRTILQELADTKGKLRSQSNAHESRLSS